MIHDWLDRFFEWLFLDHEELDALKRARKPRVMKMGDIWCCEWQDAKTGLFIFGHGKTPSEAISDYIEKRRKGLGV